MASCKRFYEKREDHKLVERKRRRHMKSLCSVLTSLIPAHHFNEKRTLSDQLLAATLYIHDLQKDVEVLEKKRETLRILSQIEGRPQKISCFEGNREINEPIDASNAFPTVKITNLCSDIQVTVNSVKKRVALWSLLEVLEGSGLGVETALQSALNDKIFYTIQCKISDAHCFDYNVIYQRLVQLVGQHRSPFQQYSTS